MKFPFRPLLLVSYLSCVMPSLAENTDYLPLMPWPQQVTVQKGQLMLSPTLKIAVQGDDLTDVITLWRSRIEAQTGWILPPQRAEAAANIRIEIAEKVSQIPQPDSDESYQLTIDGNGIRLTAKTRFGALRGMETVLQLLQNDNKGSYLPFVSIKDQPRFSWRGVLLDPARHFIPTRDIKRQLDGMASAKMNVFHWHLTDDQGWRFASDHYPKLQQLASDGMFYSKQEMKEVVNYATRLGIRVVPEIDLPGHASTIAVAYPELISAPGNYEMERHWGVHKPTLDPSNPAVYTFADTLITELTEIFPDPYIHIGGDEVDDSQWRASAKIKAFMQQNNIADTHALQAYFNRELEKLLSKHQRKMVGWDEIYHPDLPHSIVIHSWQGQDSLGKTANDGYQSILSTGFYLDQPHSTAYHYRNEVYPKPLMVKDTVGQDEQAQSWSFEMPRLKGSPVKGSFTLIKGQQGVRGFIDFAGKSRRAVNDIQLNGQHARFTLDTWMGETSPQLILDQKSKNLSGYFLIGNVRYPVTGHLLATIPENSTPVVPEQKNSHFILGGEAALWSENVTAEVVDIKLWPRTYAVAERFWSAQDVTNVDNMYLRLQAMDTWSTVSVGLQQHYRTDRGMMRLANSTAIEPLKIMAEAVESAQYYTRNHAKFQAGNYQQYEPLNRFADFLGPESLVVREMDQQVTRLLANPLDSEALIALKQRLQRWQTNDEALMKIVSANYMMKDLVPVAQDIKPIAELGLQLLDKVVAGQSLTKQQYQQAKALLDKGAQLRDEVVIRAVYPLERLLEKVKPEGVE